MKKILLLMSFIGAGYAANCEKLPPSLVKSLTDSGKNGAQYVLIVNKYDAQAGYYADVWAFNGKELKHANHIKNVDVSKVLGAGAALVNDKKAVKDLIKLKNPLNNDESLKVKDITTKSTKDKSNKDEKVKKTTKAKNKKNDDASTKNEKKKELKTAKENYKKTGEALSKAKTKKEKLEAQAAHARAGKALIKAENAVK